MKGTVPPSSSSSMVETRERIAMSRSREMASRMAGVRADDSIGVLLEDSVVGQRRTRDGQRRSLVPIPSLTFGARLGEQAGPGGLAPSRGTAPQIPRVGRNFLVGRTPWSGLRRTEKLNPVRQNKNPNGLPNRFG